MLIFSVITFSQLYFSFSYFKIQAHRQNSYRHEEILSSYFTTFQIYLLNQSLIIKMCKNSKTKIKDVDWLIASRLFKLQNLLKWKVFYDANDVLVNI